MNTIIQHLSCTFMAFAISASIGCEHRAANFFDQNLEMQIAKVADGSQTGILLYECKETDAILKTIAIRAPQVQSICLSSTDVSIEGLITIAKLEKLTLLDLDSQVGLETAWIDEIAKSRSIRRVVYWGSNDSIRTRLNDLGILADECKRPNLKESMQAGDSRLLKSKQPKQ